MEIAAWVVNWCAVTVLVVDFRKMFGQLVLVALIIEFVYVLLNHNAVEHTVKDVPELRFGRVIFSVVNIPQKRR